MIIPISPDLPLHRTPWVTTALIVVNILIFAGMAALFGANPEGFGRIQDALMVVRGPRFEWYQLFTSAFLHGGIMHIAFNMVFLYCFGRSVEDRMGSLRFLVFYLLAAAASGAAHIAFESAPALGASGAIAGVTGMFLVMFPKTQIKSFYILAGIIMVPAWWIIGFQIALNLLLMNRQDSVARMAHLGGYGFGFGVAMLLLWLHVVPRQPYDLFTSMKQAKRRREFKAAATHNANRPINSPTSAKVDAKADAKAEAIATARAAVSLAISNNDLDSAVEAYRELRSTFAENPQATTLSRNAQYRLANHMVTQGLHTEAVDAWTLFLESYHKDDEADAVRVLLARLQSDHLGQPGLAREQLHRVIEKCTDGEIKGIAAEDLRALDAQHPPEKETA